MNLIALVIIGAAAGFLATRFMKLETNVLTTVSKEYLERCSAGWFCGFC